MIDREKEAILSIRDAGDCFGTPKKVNRSTIYRWVFKGIRGAKLETLVIGSQRYTSREAISRFIACQNPEVNAPLTLSREQRDVQARSANEVLAQAGI